MIIIKAWSEQSLVGYSDDDDKLKVGFKEINTTSNLYAWSYLSLAFCKCEITENRRETLRQAVQKVFKLEVW